MYSLRRLQMQRSSSILRLLGRWSHLGQTPVPTSMQGRALASFASSNTDRKEGEVHLLCEISLGCTCNGRPLHPGLDGGG